MRTGCRCAGLVLLLLVAVVVVSGCGPGGIATTKVTGVVTLDGNAVIDASVAFTGPEGGQMATALTDATGNFTVDAPLGKNLVAVSKAVGGASSDDGLMPAEGSQPAAPKSEVPLKYANPQKSGLVVDVSKGMPEVKLELTSK